MSPVAIQAYRSINTILEINGPTLAVDTQPSDATDVAGETVTFGTSGLASASFPEGSSFTPSGTLSYAWYSSTPGSSSWTIVANGTRTNSDGTTTTITGAGTSVLSVANIKFGGDNNNQYKVRVGYNASGYDGDDFPYNAADYNLITEKYSQRSNVNIHKKDFYESVDDYFHDSIDILHIDIANNGDTYDFAIRNYLPKVKGVMILEGGSEERDNVEWMNKYNKPKIQPVLKKYADSVRITVFDDYPSLTLIKK